MGTKWVMLSTGLLQWGALGWMVGSRSVLRSSSCAADAGPIDTSKNGLHQLWENNNTFHTAKSIMDSLLISDHSHGPLLKQVMANEDSRLSTSWNESESLFSSLFQPQEYGDKSASNHTSFPYSGERSFQLTLAYRGSDFCGWQKQPNNAFSVQQNVEEWLQFLNKDRRVNVRVCGRTDAGVHAIRQVCRYRTWEPLDALDVMRHMQRIPKHVSLRCLDVKRVSPAFHPTYSATSRAYAYILDLDSDESVISQSHVPSLNDMLQRLQGLELDYYGMSYGKTTTQSTLCTIQYARASIVTHDKNHAVCIQLVGDRFLRRMVRILVSTALRETLADGDADRLLNIVKQRNRRASAVAAPPDGLVFVGACMMEQP